MAHITQVHIAKVHIAQVHIAQVHLAQAHIAQAYITHNSHVPGHIWYACERYHGMPDLAHSPHTVLGQHGAAWCSTVQHGAAVVLGSHVNVHEMLLGSGSGLVVHSTARWLRARVQLRSRLRARFPVVCMSTLLYEHPSV